MFKVINGAAAERFKSVNNLSDGRGKYPWRAMNVGDIFFVPRTALRREDGRPGVPADLRSAGLKFRTEKTIDSEGEFGAPGVKGVLVERIA